MTLKEMIAGERRSLADLADRLTEAQLQTPSLIATWTVRDVLAHLVLGIELSLPKLLLTLLTTWNMDRTTDKMTWATAQRPVAELTALLREKADQWFVPPGFGPDLVLTEVFVHGLDIRRPLGIARPLPEEGARVVLEFLTTKPAIAAKGCREGLRFEATDLSGNWSFGEGPVVRGHSEALLLALTGRSAALPELTGEGVELLRRRFSERVG